MPVNDKVLSLEEAKEPAEWNRGDRRRVLAEDELEAWERENQHKKLKEKICDLHWRV